MPTRFNCDYPLIRTSCQCLSLVYNLNTFFLELGRQTLATYAEAERVFSVRRNEGGGKDYYIKWRNLSYCEATWEDEFNVTNYYQVRIIKGAVSDFSINFPNTPLNLSTRGRSFFLLVYSSLCKTAIE